MAWLSGTKRERGSQLACQRVCQQHFCQTSNAFALQITAAQVMEPHESGGSVQYTQLEHGTIRDRSHNQGIKFTSSKMRWQSKNNTKPPFTWDRNTFHKMHVAHFSIQTSQKHFHRGHLKPHDYPLPIALPSLESSPSLHHVQDIWSRLVLGGLSFLICHILILCIVLYFSFCEWLGLSSRIVQE